MFSKDIMKYVLTIIGTLKTLVNGHLLRMLRKDQNPEIRKKRYNAIVVSGFGIVTGFIVAGDFFMN